MQRATLAEGHSCGVPLLRRATLAEGHSCRGPLLQRATLAEGHSCRGPLLRRATLAEGHSCRGPLLLRSDGPPQEWVVDARMKFLHTRTESIHVVNTVRPRRITVRPRRITVHPHENRVGQRENRVGRRREKVVCGCGRSGPLALRRSGRLVICSSLPQCRFCRGGVSRGGSH